MDVFGQALNDYFSGKRTEQLYLHTSYGVIEEMPVEVFYREEHELSELETYALDLCRGSVLDIGAGVGSHALILQSRKAEVTALEISPSACRIMEKRQVKNIINRDVFDYKEKRHDTLLLLMNGIGLCQTLEGFIRFLDHAALIIKPGGQMLFDSSDIAYLYQGQKPRKENNYYGEVKYQYEYQQIKGNWFGWLYIDPKTLQRVARSRGWMTQILYQNNNDQYLARLISASC